jgi:hypothetical protein
MWIVRLALERPYTFVVLAILILLLSPAVILRTPTDIFPNIDIPWQTPSFTEIGRILENTSMLIAGVSLTKSQSRSRTKEKDSTLIMFRTLRLQKTSDRFTAVAST